ncbi:addiction module antidote protein [Iodidimonas sp. SYSU 1G8]|uniref:addiction module antidote protein n=1 Tax=Iodidimonas sp. SYSU 1G8 TaxID=3133967 RepID=UPI0031FEE370
MPRQTKAFDASKYIRTPAAEARFLSDALESGHAGHIADALGVIAKARGISKIARDSGLPRATIYSALNHGANPTLETVLKIAAALGYGFTLAPQAISDSEEAIDLQQA